MPKLTLHIEVVRSNIIGLSSMSTVSALAVVATLGTHYSDVRLTNIDTVTDIQALIARKPDLVFLGMNFVIDENNHGAKVWLSDELEKHGIRCTGSEKFAHRLGLNKHLAKQRMLESNINTAAYTIIRRQDDIVIDETRLHFPLFVKPTDKGGGQGVDEHSIVRNSDELRAKVTQIHTEVEADALVETYLDGREFSIAVIAKHHSNELTVMPIELIAPQDGNGERMLSNVVKKSDAEEVYEVTDLHERLKIATFAATVFRALGARDYGRIDVRLDGNDVPHFLEANLIPSLIEGYGSFPRAYEINLGLNYEAMLMHIVRLALDREVIKSPVDEPKLVF